MYGSHFLRSKKANVAKHVRVPHVWGIKNQEEERKEDSRKPDSKEAPKEAEHPAFHFAARGDLQGLEALQLPKRLLDAQNTDGASALLVAARHGKAEIVRFLLNRGAQADQDKALFASVIRGHPAVAAAICKYGTIDISAIKDANDYQPLTLAMKTPQYDVAEAMIRHAKIPLKFRWRPLLTGLINEFTSGLVSHKTQLADNHQTDLVRLMRACLESPIQLAPTAGNVAAMYCLAIRTHDLGFADFVYDRTKWQDKYLSGILHTIVREENIDFLPWLAQRHDVVLEEMTVPSMVRFSDSGEAYQDDLHFGNYDSSQPVVLPASPPTLTRAVSAPTALTRKRPLVPFKRQPSLPARSANEAGEGDRKSVV